MGRCSTRTTLSDAVQAATLAIHETGGSMASSKQKRRETLAWFRDRCEWLPDDAPVPVELARGVVAASDHWFQKSAGPVATPGQAQHVTWGAYGWRIYSANSFEISLFIKRASKMILRAYQDAISGRPPKTEDLVVKIASLAHVCVSNFEDKMFDYYEHGRFILAFGSHAIFAKHAARHLLEQSGYVQALNYKPRPPRNTPTPLPEQDLSVLPKHLQDRARELRAQAAGDTPPAQAGKQAPQRPTPDPLRRWVKLAIKDARRKVPNGVTKGQQAALRELLTQLAPMMVHPQGTAEEARQRDRLWDQVASLINEASSDDLAPAHEDS